MNARVEPVHRQRLTTLEPSNSSNRSEREHPVLACPRCRFVVGVARGHELRCDNCAFVLRNEGGIWRTLPDIGQYATFMEQYETVRKAEGRGRNNPQYYLALPFQDHSGKLSWQWKIRSSTYRTLESEILPRFERKRGPGLDILDIGAGNGWLSYRLALRRHRPVALDLLVNDFDGLGCVGHYATALSHQLPCYQAAMDHLPFADDQFDLVLFNSSLHYSTNYRRTLSEAMRCIRPDGHILIMDSPVYHRRDSGERMKTATHSQFERQYGFRSDSLGSVGYLTFSMLRELGAELDLVWNLHRPWYGLKWALRPVNAFLRGKREPSKFIIAWARVSRGHAYQSR